MQLALHCRHSSTEHKDRAIRRLPLRLEGDSSERRPQNVKSSLQDDKPRHTGKGRITAGWFRTARGTRCCAEWLFPSPSSCARRQLRTETGLRDGHSLGQEAFVPRALTALLGMQSLHFQNESAFLRDLFPQGAEWERPGFSQCPLLFPWLPQ